MEFELVIFLGRVGHGLKETGCSAALTKCTSMSDRSTIFFLITMKFNESYCEFSYTERTELKRARARCVAKPRVFPRGRVLQPPP